MSENFESLGQNLGEGAALTASGTWQDSAFGRDFVLKRHEPGGFALTAAAGGDHHAYWQPAAENLHELLLSPAWMLECTYQGTLRLSFGDCQKYAVKAGLVLNLLKDGPSLTDGTGQAALAVCRNQKPEKSWGKLRLLCRRPSATDAKWRVSLALAARGEEFIRLPGLDNLEVDWGQLPPEKWNGVDIRQDGPAALDDLSWRAVADAGKLLAEMPVADTTPAFAALLGHVLPPRTAQDLSGIWEFFASPAANLLPAADAAWRPVLVPDQHRPLFGREGRGWFRKKFTSPVLPEGDRAELAFEGVVDTCDVYVNGVHVGRHEGDWMPFGFDVTEALHPEGENELLVGVIAPWNGEPATDRPVAWPWFTAEFTGIAFPVHLETRAPVYIADVFVQPALAGGARLTTQVTLVNDTNREAKIELGGGVAGLFTHTAQNLTIPPHRRLQATLADAWAEPPLWWPHDPRLLDLDLKLNSDGQTLDALRTRFGFRELRVDGVDLRLNGKRFIHRRDSAIVYWPRIRAGELREYFTRLRERGYNGARLHGSGSPRVLIMADEMGMLIGLESKVNEPRGHEVSETYWSRASDHLEKLVRKNRNHPSVIYWCVSNEFGSAYMSRESAPEQKRWVDEWLDLMGRRMMRLDPTRTVTFCGDLELGGLGRHGPAPNLSYHYPWQSYKPQCQIPRTVYWLEEGGRPWQGVVWDRTKPLFLNECLFPEYCFNPPRGLAQWGGDTVYADAGYHQAWFDALRMFAEGYYHAPVACVNPWGTAAGQAEAPLFKSGQPFPDFLLATREFGANFTGGETAARTLFVYNQTFRDHACRLSARLEVGGRPAGDLTREFELVGGERQDFQFALVFPPVEQRTDAAWRLELRAGDEMLTARTFAYVVYPAKSAPIAPPQTALVASVEFNEALKNINFPAGRFATVAEALAAKPANLVVAGGALTPEAEAQLGTAVAAGLRVLLLEMKGDSRLPAPLRLGNGQFGFYAFVRAPHDPLLAGMADADLRWWRDDLEVARNSPLKPNEGNCDVLVDAADGNGLKYASLLRLYRGQGHYTLCQLPILSKLAQEPAAGYWLERLLARFPAAGRPAGRQLQVLATPDSLLTQRLKELAVPFAPIDKDGMGATVLVQGDAPAAVAAATQLLAAARAGGTILVQRPNSELAAALSQGLGGQIELIAQACGKAARTTDSPLLDGISNEELYWVNEKKRSAKLKERENGGTLARELPRFSGGLRPRELTAPAVLSEIRLGAGRLILCQIRWDEAGGAFPAESARLARTLLKNCGAEIGGRELGRRSFRPFPLQLAANRGFHDRPERTDLPRGWFAGAEDDLRYFPVNLTGLDPFNDVPQPKEEFPAGPTYYAGIPFSLTNPETNAGRACLILGGTREPQAPPQATLPIDGKVDSLWFLGALEKMRPAESPAATLVWRYADGGQGETVLRAGVDLQGYQYQTSVSTGLVGWRGDTRKHVDAVLWVWRCINPHPERSVAAVELSTAPAVGLAIAGMTGETAGE